jgi:hypothetical protein
LVPLSTAIPKGFRIQTALETGEEMSKQVWSIIGGIALVVSISAILWLSKIGKLDVIPAIILLLAAFFTFWLLFGRKTKKK